VGRRGLLERGADAGRVRDVAAQRQRAGGRGERERGVRARDGGDRPAVIAQLLHHRPPEVARAEDQRAALLPVVVHGWSMTAALDHPSRASLQRARQPLVIL
jgi:hypothetical protein